MKKSKNAVNSITFCSFTTIIAQRRFISIIPEPFFCMMRQSIKNVYAIKITSQGSKKKEKNKIK